MNIAKTNRDQHPAEQMLPPPTCRGERTSDRFETHIRASWPTGSFMIERHGNVGIGGFCFEADDALPEGTNVRLLIKLTGTKHWIRVTGEVLGQTDRHGKVGVRGRFSKIHHEDERQLARWLDLRSRETRAA